MMTEESPPVLDGTVHNNEFVNDSNNQVSPQWQQQQQQQQNQKIHDPTSFESHNDLPSNFKNAPTATPFSPPPPSPLPSSSPSTAYHPSFMFCGSCTGCGDTSAIPSQSMLTTFPNNRTTTTGGPSSLIKKKKRTKMVFISDFEESNDNGFGRIGSDNNVECGEVTTAVENGNSDGRNNNDNNDNIFTVTSEVSFEKLDKSQRLLVKKVLEGMEHVHSFNIRNIYSNNNNSDNKDIESDNHKNDDSNYLLTDSSSDDEETCINHMIDIEYNPNVVSITKILESFHDLGLKNTIQHTRATKQTVPNQEKSNLYHNNYDNTISTSPVKLSMQNSTLKCRSSFFVDGICCASEVPIVTSIIKTIPSKRQYIYKVSINITNRMVYVEYDPDFVTASDIHNALVQEGFERSTIEQDGNALLEKRRRKKKKDEDNLVRKENENGNNSANGSSSSSLETNIKGNIDRLNDSDSYYVESVICLPHLSDDTIEIMHEIFYVNDLLYDYIRAYSPNIASHTVKIEHDPKLTSIQNVMDLLLKDDSGREIFRNCQILVDGFQEGLSLPSTPIGHGDHDVNDFLTHSSSRKLNQKVLRCLRTCGIGTPHGLSITIILSGLFWILSIFGHFYDNTILEIMGLFAVLFGLPPVAKKAFRTLRRRQFDANCMMVTAALGAVALQQFDEAASVSFLFAISEYLEDRATRKARKAMDDIIHLRPDYANLIDNDTGEIKIVPVNDLDVGDLVSIRMGDKIPSDGVVVEGFSQIDEASLTGESRPINKGVGDVVSGGTINVGNTRLVVRITALVEDSAVSRLIRLVEESASSRSPTEQLVDAFARSYTPTVIFVAVFLCTIPWFWGNEIGRRWTLNGLIIIVIACPCALTISTPVTYAAGLAATAKKGIIVKGGAKLEALGKVKRIVFDKTGTLTEGKFRLVDLQVVGLKRTRREVLELLAVMEGPSSHPLAATLVNAAKDEGVISSNNISVTDHSILKGEGVTAIVNGKQTYVGNVRLFKRLGMYDDLVDGERNKVKKWNDEGSTVGLIGMEGLGIIGIFCVADAVRAEAKDVVQALISDGIEIFMLTGDGSGPAFAVASEVGIPQDYVQSQFLPEDKLHYVASMLKSSKKGSLFNSQELLLMCGDGVNDAPALAVADVGVAMGEGAALALEISDVTLMDSNLSKLLFSIETGMRVIVTVQENIAVSVAAKIAVIILTFMGKMSLLGAIASDVGVMLLVSINGMKLLPGGGPGCRRRAKYGKIDLQQPMNDIV